MFVAKTRVASPARRGPTLPAIILAGFLSLATPAFPANSVSTATWITTKASLGGTVDFTLFNLSTSDQVFTWQIQVPPPLLGMGITSGTVIVPAGGFVDNALEVSVPHGTPPGLYALPFHWQNAKTGESGTDEGRIYTTPFDSSHPLFRPAAAVTIVGSAPGFVATIASCLVDSAGLATAWRLPCEPPFDYVTVAKSADPDRPALFVVTPATDTLEIVEGPPVEIVQAAVLPVSSGITVNEITLSMHLLGSSVAWTRYTVIGPYLTSQPIVKTTWGEVKALR